MNIRQTMFNYALQDNYYPHKSATITQQININNHR